MGRRTRPWLLFDCLFLLRYGRMQSSHCPIVRFELGQGQIRSPGTANSGRPGPEDVDGPLLVVEFCNEDMDAGEQVGGAFPFGTSTSSWSQLWTRWFSQLVFDVRVQATDAMLISVFGAAWRTQ